MKKLLVEIKAPNIYNNNKVGDKVYVDFDKNNNPVDGYWQRRFQDAKIDKSVEIVPEIKVETKPTNMI